MNKDLRTAFKKFLTYFSITLIVSIVIACFTFFLCFRETYQKFYIRQLFDMHEQIAENIVNTEYQYQKISGFLLGDNDIALLVNDVTENNIDTRFKAITTIERIKNLYNLERLTIINESLNTIFEGENMFSHELDDYRNSNAGFDQYYKLYKSGENYFTEDNNIIYFSQDFNNNIVMFKIKYDQFEKQIISSADDGIKRWVYYNHTTPLISWDNSNILKDEQIAAKSYGENSSGYFIYRKTMYAYSNNYSIRCISSVPYINVMIDGIVQVAVVGFLIFILLGMLIFLIWYLIIFLNRFRNLYKENILERDMKLKSSISEVETTKLFREINSDYKKLCEDIENCGYNTYTAYLIINRDAAPTFKNQVKEIFQKHGYSIVVNVSNDEIGVIFASDNKENGDSCIADIKKLTGSRSAIIKGIWSDNVEDLFDSIENINNLKSYIFIAGYGNEICEDQIRVNNSESQYPIDIQRDIIKTCNDGNTDKLKDFLNNFIEYIAANDYRMAQNWTLMLFINIMRTASIFKNPPSFQTINKVTEAETFADAALILIKYIDENVITAKEKNNLLNKINAITEENYYKLDYDVKQAAEILGISSVHLSRRMKQLLGQSFSPYLTEFRINKSMELLKNSDLSVNDIAEKCGFGSSTYFCTVFKKRMLMTPQEYRKRSENDSECVTVKPT